MLLWVAFIPYNIAGCSDAGSPATATAAAATLPDEHDERTLAVIWIWDVLKSMQNPTFLVLNI